MASDVCKHCTEAACLDVCPTGSLFRTEFGTVVVQEDICNGCGYCISACPFGVIDQRKDDGRAWKCTLCYDRLTADMEPACAKACPTESIQFGPLDELASARGRRVEQLHGLGRDGRPTLRGRSRRRGRWCRGLLPPARRARGLRPSSRSRGDDPRPAPDVARGRRGRAVARRYGGARVRGRATLSSDVTKQGVSGSRSGRERDHRCERRLESRRQTTLPGRAAGRARRRVRVLLRQAGLERAGLERARDRRLPLPRWSRRRLVSARRRRAGHRSAGARHARQGGRNRCDRARGRRARQGPRSALAVREHVARREADLAHEHRRRGCSRATGRRRRWRP